MPANPRVRANNAFGITTDNPLTAGAAVFNSNQLVYLPGVVAQHAIITLDPIRQYGDPEIVVVTVHTAASTVATIIRGQYGTSARSHPQGTVWAHAPVGPDDYTAIVTSGTRPSDPYEGQMIYETDTDFYMGHNGTTWEHGLKLGQWIDWTPTLSQGASTNITKTVSYARYNKVGRTVTAIWHLVVTGSGTAAASVAVSLPININATLGALASDLPGSICVFDSSTNTYYFGNTSNAGTANKAFGRPLTTIGLGSQFLGIGGTAGTTLFSAALASNDIVTGSIVYEAVS